MPRDGVLLFGCGVQQDTHTRAQETEQHATRGRHKEDQPMQSLAVGTMQEGGIPALAPEFSIHSLKMQR